MYLCILTQFKRILKIWWFPWELYTNYNYLNWLCSYFGIINDREDDQFLIETWSSETSTEIGGNFRNNVRSGTSSVKVKVIVRFHVLTTASTKMIDFWDTVPCNLVEVDRRFRGAHWRQYALLKCRSTSTRLHGAISQKPVIFVMVSGSENN
jgi:hypothetical protein